MGAENTGELGALAQVQLAAGGDARQRVQECGFIVIRADPTNVGLAAAGICPEGRTSDVLAYLVRLDNGIICGA